MARIGLGSCACLGYDNLRRVIEGLDRQMERF